VFQKDPKILSVNEIIDWNTNRKLSAKTEVIKEVTQAPTAKIDNFIEKELDFQETVSVVKPEFISSSNKRSNEILWII